MSQLLVSVRSLSECQLALDSGLVDLIDVKEPDRGALGAADPSVVQQILTAATGRRPVSVALGELRDRSVTRSVPTGIDFAKVGLAGCARWPRWPDAWQALVDSWPRSIQWVAVAYADHHLAGSPPWREVLEQAARLGCRVILVDTYDKQAGRLLDWLPCDELARVCRAAAAIGTRCALAGSLTAHDVRRIAEHVAPDWIAVRTAACDGNRQGTVSRQALCDLSAAVQVQHRRKHKPFELPLSSG